MLKSSRVLIRKFDTWIYISEDFENNRKKYYLNFKAEVFTAQLNLTHL